MGLFDDLDIANAEDRPKLVGKFDGEISGAEIQLGSTNNPDAVMIVLATALENKNGGTFEMKKWYMVPQGAPSTWDTTERPTKSGKGTTSDFQLNQRYRTALKELFKGLGFEPEVMNSVNENNIGDLLTGIPVSATLRAQQNSDFSEISRIVRKGSSGVSAPVARPTGAPVAAAPSAPAAPATPAVPANNPFAKQ